MTKEEKLDDQDDSAKRSQEYLERDALIKVAETAAIAHDFLINKIGMHHSKIVRDLGLALDEFDKVIK